LNCNCQTFGQANVSKKRTTPGHVAFGTDGKARTGKYGNRVRIGLIASYRAATIGHQKSAIRKYGDPDC
jgi:hypothetical protein